MASFKLILQSGSGAGTEYPLEKAELFLGRDLSNDIVVNEAEVSRRHVRLLQQGNTYSIEDLGSTNGTFIRGQRLGAPVVLKPGEIINLGEGVVLRFDVLVTDPSATVASMRGSAQQTQPQIPPAPRVTPPAPIYPPPAQPFVQAIPPVAQYMPVVPKKKKGWLVALLIVVGILLVFCLIPWIIIDATNSYCGLFPGIFNAIQPGVCP